MSQYVGRSLRRREDAALLVGRGRFATDIALEGLCHLGIVRSQVAHGRIERLDLDAVRSMPGVIAAWSARDIHDDLGPLMPATAGLATIGHPVLSTDEVCYAGQPVAFILAEDELCAADAVESSVLDVRSVPAAVDVREAFAGAAPVHTSLRSNVAGTMVKGFGDADRAFRNAEVTVQIDLSLARVSAGYLEPRSATARPDGPRQVTLWSSTQSVYGVRETVARVLGLDLDDVTVLATDVGGGFGGKGVSYAEDVIAAFAAMQIRRPVRWTGSRRDDTQSSIQAHGQLLEIEVAADHSGALLGIRGRVLYDLGAYLLTGLAQIDNIASHFIGPYRLPALELRFDLVHTNTVPTGFIRGGGREIGTYCVERLMDALADKVEVSRTEIRRRNLVKRSEMPRDTMYRTPAGPVVHDGGDRLALMDMVLAAVDMAEIQRRREAGGVVGVGLAMSVESTGIGAAETARVTIHRSGNAVVRVGSSPQGQGHATAFAQVAADHLGLEPSRVSVELGRTWPDGAASAVIGASRSALEFGNAIAIAAASARSELLRRAAGVLEADPLDLEIGEAGVHVVGSPSRSVDLEGIVEGGGLVAEEVYDPGGAKSHASGAHVAVVEIDLETAAVTVNHYLAAHDVGRPINPLIVDGQIDGGIAHGIGYALFEEAVYDQSGNLATATFADYMIPSAPDIAFVPELIHHDVRAGNPEGFRGVGEGGTIPAAAAITSAVEDALKAAGHPTLLTQLPVSPASLHRLLYTSAEVHE